MNNLLLRIAQFFGFMPGTSFISKLKKEGVSSKWRNKTYKDIWIKSVFSKEVSLEWDGNEFIQLNKIVSKGAVVQLIGNKITLCRLVGFAKAELAMKMEPHYFIDEDPEVNIFGTYYWKDIQEVNTLRDYLKYRATFAIEVTKEDYAYYLSIAGKGRKIRN